MNWRQALDSQDGLTRWWRSPRGRQFAESFAGALAEGEDFSADQIQGQQLATLRTAEPIYVTADVLDLVEHAVKTFQSEPLQREDLIVPAGWLVCERPLMVEDRVGRKMAFRAFGWVPAHAKLTGADGIIMSSYSHTEDRDDFTEELKLVAPEESYRFLGTEWVLAHFTPWWFGVAPPSKPEDFARRDLTPTEVDRQVAAYRVNQCLLRFLVQTITVAQREQAPRQMRRRAEREGREVQETIVVTLRRRSNAQKRDGESEREYHVRWIVSGHWRNQPYRSTGTHRQIWIDPYLKGPEEAPFKEPAQRVLVARR